jgi:hypothetical protein
MPRSQFEDCLLQWFNFNFKCHSKLLNVIKYTLLSICYLLKISKEEEETLYCTFYKLKAINSVR